MEKDIISTASAKDLAANFIMDIEEGCSLEKREIFLYAKENGVDICSKKEWRFVRYLYRREFWKKKLAIIIPTANRSEAIEYYLKAMGSTLSILGIDIIVYDSSDTDDTFQVVKKCRKDKAKTAQYRRYVGNFDGVSLDEKVRAALSEYCDCYEYLWVCRDGLIINFSAIYNGIYCILQTSRPDVISVYSKEEDYEKIGCKVYDNCTDFFGDNFRHMTILGAIIVKSRFAQQVIDAEPIDSELNYGLWYPTAVFHYLADHKANMQTFVGNTFFSNAFATPSSFWNRKGRALWQWGERWYKIVKNMPEVYNKEKDRVRIIEMQDFHPFGNMELLIMRGTKSLTYKSIRENKRYLIHVTRTPIWWFYCVATIPSFIARKVFGNPRNIITRTLYLIGKRIVKVTGRKREEPDGHTATNNWWR